MASVSAFNDMLSQFLVELHGTFPDEPGIKKMTTSFELIKKTNPRLVVDNFMNGVTPYSQQISSKDDKFILEEMDKISFLKDLNIRGYWDRMSDNTKAITWQYIQTLFMLGSTIRVIPADTLDMIEKVAKDCTDKLQSENGTVDQDALMKMMGTMLDGMNKK